MIYTVECTFADPASEAEWNDFYSREKLPALISVTGFQSSQRFRAVTGGCPVYLAIHTVDGPEVLISDEYRQKGGGNFARWQQHITDWHRNLYGDIGLAPAVRMNERLALCASGPESLIDMGLKPLALQAVALEQVPTHRWLAVVSADDAVRLAEPPQGVHLYVPMGEQLTRGETRR
ncbi:sugar ABC transporter [Pandoraea anapnoica]|nr:sugar ABC transporter [Pandoraea anapnoica]